MSVIRVIHDSKITLNGMFKLWGPNQKIWHSTRFGGVWCVRLEAGAGSFTRSWRRLYCRKQDAPFSSSTGGGE